MKILKRIIPLMLVMIMLLSNTTTAFAAVTRYIAEPTTTKITVDGKAITARTFNLDYKATIYVKVHDIAKAVSATKKKFSVTVDTKKNTMTLKPGKTYKVIGGENKKYTQTKQYKESGFDIAEYKAMKLYKDSTKQSAKVYLINKEYYVALKSVAKIADFSLEFNEPKARYEINTEYGYGESTKPIKTTPTDSDSLLKEPFPNAELVANPKTLEDCYNIITYLSVNSILDYSFNTTTGDLESNELEDMFKLVQATMLNENYCPELFYGVLGRMYIHVEDNGVNNNVSIKLRGASNFGDSNKKLVKMNTKYHEKAKEAVQSLIDTGEIKEGMTEKERAHAVLVWITENVTYGGGISGENPTGYGALINGQTVCTGYTALYQLMCRYVGIYEMQGVTGTGKAIPLGHMWTAQVLDGKKVMTDPTWSDYDFDPEEDLREWHDTYFAKTSKFFLQNHIWDTEEYSKWN